MKLDINIFGYLVILFIIGFTLKIYFESEMFHLKCIVSDEDGHTYCVRETPKLELVADLLAKNQRLPIELSIWTPHLLLLIIVCIGLVRINEK